MTLNPMEAAFAAWKQQFDLGLAIAAAIVEGTEKARKIQLDTAVQTRGWLESARNSFSTASDAGLAAVQARLAKEMFSNMTQYWSQLGANARDTQLRIAELAQKSMAATPLFAQTAQPVVAGSDLNGLIDAGFKQWMETLGRMYAVPAKAEKV